MASQVWAERLIECFRFHQQHLLSLDVLRSRTAQMSNASDSEALDQDIDLIAKAWPHIHERLVAVFTANFTNEEIDELCMQCDRTVMRKFFSADIRRLIIVALIPNNM